MTPTDPSLAIGILAMPGEESDTVRVTSVLAGARRPGDTIYVHCNGFADGSAAGRFVDELSNLDVVTSVSESNLGDVGGRNRLSTLPGFREHAAAVFLDNDIVASIDLLGTFRAAVATLGSDPTIGAIAAPAYSYRRLRELVPEAFSGSVASDPSAPEVFDVDTFRALNDALPKPIRPSISGSNIDWRTAYLSAVPYVARAFRQARPRWQRSIHESADFRSRAAAGEPIQVGAVPGGVTCVPMRHLSHERPFDEIFRPFGAGDISFSIGLHERGFRNVVLPDAAIPHGTHSRHDERRLPGARLADQVNRARGRALLAARHDSHGPRPAVTALRKVIGEQVLQLSRRKVPSSRAVWAGLVGGVIAERQLAGAPTEVDWSVPMTPAVAALAPSRFEGAPDTTLPTLVDFLRRWRELEAVLGASSASLDARIDHVSSQLVEARDDLLSGLTPLLIAGVDPLSDSLLDGGAEAGRAAS